MYGIQLESDDPEAYDPLKWKGYNKLGFQITKVRDSYLDVGHSQITQKEESDQISKENTYVKESLKNSNFGYVKFTSKFNQEEIDLKRPGPGCFSHFFPIKFIDKNGIEYTSCYQYLMSQKALFFDESDIFLYKKIMKTNDFREMKNLGRKIKNFDQKIWDSISTDFVFEGNLYKFGQHEKLYEYLLSFNSNSLFVNCDLNNEAYSINLDINDPKSNDPSEWKGLNNLGFQVTKVRDVLLKSTSNLRFISYAYDDKVTSIFYSEKVESIDLISSGVVDVNLNNYPNLNRIRISKCHNLNSIKLSNMPKLIVADFLDNKRLLSVSFKNCPELKTLDIGYCPKLKSLDGIESIEYLSAPRCYSIGSFPFVKCLVYADFSNVSFDANQLLTHEENLECLVCSN